jgi:hypothetical protein
MKEMKYVSEEMEQTWSSELLRKGLREKAEKEIPDSRKYKEYKKFYKVGNGVGFGDRFFRIRNLIFIVIIFNLVKSKICAGNVVLGIRDKLHYLGARV